MEATALTAAESICAKDHELKRVDWLNIGLLLLLASLLHGWMIANTEVAARDSIGFIRYALHLEQYPWSNVIERCDQHPGYAVAVLALSYPARYFLGSSPETLALSAQLASCIAAVLMVIPLYFLTREFFDRRVAFAAAVLFKVLPVSLQVTSDGVSEATFLLFLSTALLFSCQGLHRRSIVRFILAGFFGGLAYLTRPEGALIVAATGITLLGLQVLPWCRWPWQRTLACGSGLALAAILTAAPYVAIIGNITNKPTAKKMMTSLDTLHDISSEDSAKTNNAHQSPPWWGIEFITASSPPPQPTPKKEGECFTRPAGVVTSPLMATLFGVWWCDVGEGKHPP